MLCKSALWCDAPLVYFLPIDPLDNRQSTLDAMLPCSTPFDHRMLTTLSTLFLISPHLLDASTNRDAQLPSFSLVRIHEKEQPLDKFDAQIY